MRVLGPGTTAGRRRCGALAACRNGVANSADLRLLVVLLVLVVALLAGLKSAVCWRAVARILLLLLVLVLAVLLLLLWRVLRVALVIGAALVWRRVALLAWGRRSIRGGATVLAVLRVLLAVLLAVLLLAVLVVGVGHGVERCSVH